MTRNDIYEKKNVLEKDDIQETNENKDDTSESLLEMIDAAKNTGLTPWTIFLADIGFINAIDMTGTVNRNSGEHKLLVLDDTGGMWQIREEFVIARRTNIMNAEDYEYFNEMKKQSEESIKKWEETEKKLDLDSSFL